MVVAGEATLGVGVVREPFVVGAAEQGLEAAADLREARDFDVGEVGEFGEVPVRGVHVEVRHGGVGTVGDVLEGFVGSGGGAGERVLDGSDGLVNVVAGGAGQEIERAGVAVARRVDGAPADGFVLLGGVDRE